MCEFAVGHGDANESGIASTCLCQCNETSLYIIKVHFETFLSLLKPCRRIFLISVSILPNFVFLLLH